MITCGSVISLQILCIRKVAFSYCALVFFFFFTRVLSTVDLDMVLNIQF